MAEAFAGNRPDAAHDAPAETSAIPLAGSGTEALVSDGESALPPEELIEPGRALALVDFAPPAIGAGDRLVRLAYRLGVPATALTHPFRKPARPRLLATVANSLVGDKVAGTALRAGHFLVHGAKLPFAQIDFAGAARLSAPVERTIHGFGWLADLEAAAPREQVTAVAERVLATWLDANPKPPGRPGKGPVWTIDTAGNRLLNWLVNAPLILSGSDKAQRARTFAAIGETARWLDRHVGRAEDQLATLAGWSAITAAGLLLPDGKPRRLYGESGLIRTLGELVGDDGGIVSRSPLGQAEAIALLAQLRACYRATRRDPPAAIEGILGLLVPPLLALVHGDGGIGSWQGAWALGPERIAALVAASGVRTRPLRDVRQWGYQRVAAHKSVLQFDAAPPPLPRHARTGCASTLAFEFSHGGQRLVVNCGGAAAAGGLIPARLEQGLRATAAHSTLILDETNSTAVLINGKLGSGVAEVEVDRRTIEGERAVNGRGARAAWGATRLEAAHDGYAGRYGLTHRRILILRDDGSELRGEDLLVPTKGKGKRGKVGYAIRFHLGPGIDVRRSDDGQGVGLGLPDGSVWQFRSGAGEVTVEESIWADVHGRPQATQQLVLQGLVSRGGGTFAWLLKKMG
ncbi:MAG: heparinase II/III family protein [Novosphingobium sp.]|nr:heparinase II/III family protein [Novosphingobium sp.]